jgi:hypothetical protein
MGGVAQARMFDAQYLERIRDAAKKWEGEKRVPERVQELWAVVANLDADISQTSGTSTAFCDACLELLAIADEACTGIGFLDSKDPASFASYFLEQYKKHVSKEAAELPYLPHSLCIKIAPSALCVQPKTSTPQVGASLRSLSHNLCLLPGRGEVVTRWHIATHTTDASSVQQPPLNLLLIPFPYIIEGSCFQRGQSADDGVEYFSVEQKWLSGFKEEALCSSVQALIDSARREVGCVSGVVFPEAALSEAMAVALARALARQKVEFLVTGILTDDHARNGVYSAVFFENEIYREWRQWKHHRWQLNDRQIRRYHLGHVLNPSNTWWEKIDITERECSFYVFRHGACMCALVCEDLARIEPVQGALRAVGPNLVITVLMDGPQSLDRWSARYATVLADDPGSAVLTLTSLGMAKRSFMPGQEGYCPVALWKDPYGSAQSLSLPDGCHALVLTIAQSWEPQRTLDGRSDQGSTAQLTLAGVRAIRSPRRSGVLDCVGDHR